MVYEDQQSHEACTENAAYFHTKGQFQTYIQRVTGMSELPPGSELIMYYTGHGSKTYGAWVLKGVQDDTYPSLSSLGFSEASDSKCKRELFSVGDCVKLITRDPPMPVTVVCDCCHSGAWLQQERLAEANNLRIIAACSKEQVTEVRELLNYLTQGLQSSTATPCQLHLKYNHNSVLCCHAPVPAG